MIHSDAAINNCVDAAVRETGLFRSSWQLHAALQKLWRQKPTLDLAPKGRDFAHCFPRGPWVCASPSLLDTGPRDGVSREELDMERSFGKIIAEAK